MNAPSTKSLFALPLRCVLAGAALVAILAGCSMVAEPNRALDRPRGGYREPQDDPQITQLAPAALTQTGEAVGAADTAWTQRESSLAVVARTGAGSDKARADDRKAARDLLLAQRDTQEKAIEPAVAKAAEHDKWRATDLEMQLKDLNQKPTERGDVISLGDVLFDSNRAALRSGGLRDMAKLVDFFKRYPNRTALIEGFTDSLGSERDNLQLSQRRAASVRNALIDQGVSADRLTSRGHGEAHPASTNTTQAGRQANRRVEIVLSGEDGIVKAR